MKSIRDRTRLFNHGVYVGVPMTTRILDAAKWEICGLLLYEQGTREKIALAFWTLRSPETVRKFLRKVRCLDQAGRIRLRTELSWLAGGGRTESQQMEPVGDIDEVEGANHVVRMFQVILDTFVAGRRWFRGEQIGIEGEIPAHLIVSMQAHFRPLVGNQPTLETAVFRLSDDGRISERVSVPTSIALPLEGRVAYSGEERRRMFRLRQERDPSRSSLENDLGL